MGKPNGVKNEFSSLLREALRDVRGRVPSAAVIAREFNLRAVGVEPVTQESVRRWLRGISMPEEKKMAILVSWLDLDLSAVMKRAHSAAYNGNGYGNGNGTGRALADVLHRHPSASHSGEVDRQTLERAKMINRLSPKDRQLIEEFMNRLDQRGSPERSGFSGGGGGAAGPHENLITKMGLWFDPDPNTRLIKPSDRP